MKAWFDEGDKCVVQNLDYNPATSAGENRKRKHTSEIAAAVPAVSVPVALLSKRTKGSEKKVNEGTNISVFHARDKHDRTASSPAIDSTMSQSSAPAEDRKSVVGVPGLLAFPELPEPDDDEKEVNSPRNKDEQRISAMQHVRGKLVMTANALERNHASLSALVERLRGCTVLSRAHPDNPTEGTASALRNFPRSNSTVANQIVEPANTVLKEMYAYGPTYANRLFDCSWPRHRTCTTAKH